MCLAALVVSSGGQDRPVGDERPDGLFDAAQPTRGCVHDRHAGRVTRGFYAVVDVVSRELPAEDDERVTAGADAFVDGVEGFAGAAKVFGDVDAGAGEVMEPVLLATPAQSADDEDVLVEQLLAHAFGAACALGRAPLGEVGQLCPR